MHGAHIVYEAYGANRALITFGAFVIRVSGAYEAYMERSEHLERLQTVVSKAFDTCWLSEAIEAFEVSEASEAPVLKKVFGMNLF